MKIGAKIKQRRIELGWTLRDLADRMGYANHSTIARIEGGAVDVPQSKIVKFSEVLGVSLGYLMGEAEVVTPVTSLEEGVHTQTCVEDLFSYLEASPTAPHAIEETECRLKREGYEELRESAPWKISLGGKYYVKRGLGALIAFRLPSQMPKGAMMVASHSDSPTFAITPSLTAVTGNYTRLTTEKYGGMLCATWLDRPLSVAGVVVVRGADGTLCPRTINIDEDLVMIPSVAIHMNRNANEGATYNPAVDMQPLWGGKQTTSLLTRIAQEAGVREEDVVSHELWLYNRQKPTIYGAAGEFIGAPRLDDLGCAYGALKGFLASRESEAMPLYALLDNEEVGSATYGGAGSDFLATTLRRICVALGLDDEAAPRFLAHSFLVSADNAHAIHPNHPEYADAHNAPTMGGGVVLKYNANRRYATDAISYGVFADICQRAGVKTQTYCNRPDIPGGSTLGCISMTQVSVPTIDIGLAQLSMHSSYETMGREDIVTLERALTAFYSTSLAFDEDGNLILQ